MKRHALLIGLGLALTLLFIGSGLGYYPIPFANKLERVDYDYKLRATMPGGIDKRIVILDIDEKSLREEGRWPWNRDRLALLVSKLFDQQDVAVLGFDVVFAEKDQSSGLKVLQDLARGPLKGVPRYRAALDKIRPKLQYDRLFADSLKGRNVILGYYFTTGNVSGALPPPALPAGAFEGHDVPIIEHDGYGGNLPELQDNAAGAGHFNPILDEDGVVRRIPMLVEYQGQYYESLSLAVARAVLGQTEIKPEFVHGYGALDWLDLRTAKKLYKIPMDVNTDGYGGHVISTMVPYRGPPRSFRYVSVADVLHDRIPPGTLKGKIVLVGTSAPGLQDLRSTPVAPVYPGVEVHANMVAGILDGAIKQQPAYLAVVEALVLLVFGGSLSLLMPLLSPVRITLAAAGALLLLVILDLWFWAGGNLELPAARSFMLVAVLFVMNMSYGYFVESRAKSKITNLFGQYVPTELVEEMSQRPEEVSMESENREMTILFSDVRGFTTIAEGMDPKELSQFMNAFLTAFTQVIHRHRGTIDKYMGDCIMAFWGAPLHSATHARDAVLAGLEMFRVLRSLQEEFKARGWPEIRMGVGVNTGRVNVGNMGSAVRVAYTVMGDAVNLASRLESITKEYRIDFIVGESTRTAVPDMVYREIDLVRVKGKDEPVSIYEPIGPEGEVEKDRLDEIKLFHQTLKLYRKQEWDQVDVNLLNLQRMSPKTRLYQIYMDRVAFFRNNPPGPEWDGVFVWKIK